MASDGPSATQSLSISKPLKCKLSLRGVGWSELGPALSDPGVEDDQVRKANLAELFLAAVSESLDLDRSRIVVTGIHT